MQQLHGTQDSDMTLDALPATSEPGHDTAYRLKPQDENVVTLAPLSKSVAEGQVNDASAPHINVGAQTVFAVATDTARREKIYIAGSIVVLAAVAIAIPVFYLTHSVSSTTIVTSPVTIAQSAANDITRQFSPVANSSIDEAAALTLSAIPVTAGEENAENSFEYTGTAEPTDSGNPGQHGDGTSTSFEPIAPAETSAVTTLSFSAPITTDARAFAPDTDATAIVNYAAESDTEEFHIIRGKAPDRGGALINAAYAAYVAGNYSDAAQVYLGVLQGTPNHRDALLGMAAIALRTGDPDEAGRIWLQVLADYPDDPVATTALIDLMDAQDYPDSTRVIRKLLQDYPHAAFLYFTLGNLQAAAYHWTEARQAFAEAFRLESDNPDYAYNLAVSLEHAGDGRAALDMYKTALELAHDRPVHFNDSEILARITVLSEISHGR